MGQARSALGDTEERLCALRTSHRELVRPIISGLHNDVATYTATATAYRTLLTGLGPLQAGLLEAAHGRHEEARQRFEAQEGALQAQRRRGQELVARWVRPLCE